jgi:predicted DNA-binding transcriptional regulator AlpA
MPESELVGRVEIAEMLGVVRQYVHRLSIEDPTFPKPAGEVGGRTVYRRSDVEKWAKATGRTVQS